MTEIKTFGELKVGDVIYAYHIDDYANRQELEIAHIDMYDVLSIYFKDNSLYDTYFEAGSFINMYEHNNFKVVYTTIKETLLSRIIRISYDTGRTVLQKQIQSLIGLT